MDEDEIDSLILQGAVRPAGIDSDTGEMLYEFTEKLLEVAPNVFYSILDSHVREIYHLWELGFVDMNISEDNPSVMITEKALDSDEIEKLSPYMRSVVKEIVRLSRKNSED